MLKFHLYALSFIPSVHAWTFLYTNATNNATILHETETVNCSKIDLAKGKEFSWDPEGADVCISIYYDTECTSRGGLSCGAWKKDSGNNYHGIQVFTNDDAASTSESSISTSSPTATSTSFSTSTSRTPTATITAPADSSSGSDSSKASLSGGAIAGIAIGIIAAILLVGAILYYFGRRNRRPASCHSASTVPRPYKPTLSDMQAAMPPHEFAIASIEKTPPPSRGRPVPGSKLVELPGNERSAEMDNSPISDIQSRSDMRYSRF